MANEVQNKKDILDITKQLLEVSKELAGEDGERLQQNKDMSKTLEQISKNKSDINKLSEISSDLEDQLLTAKAEGNKALEKEIGYLQRVIKMKQKENRAQENINTAYKDLGGKLGLGGLIGLAESFQKAGAEAGGEMVKSLMVAGIVITGLVSLFTALANQTDSIGTKFGAIDVNEFGSELRDATINAQQLGFTFDEAAGSILELSSNFGVAFDEAANMSKVTMDTARALGISTDQAAQLTGMLITMGGHSAETAQNFLKQTAALAKSAGVAPSAVLGDMASSSEDIAGFIQDGGENMAQAAVKARSMGVSIGDVAKAARGMLDFQSSIAAEMEASVMIGKQLNFQKARELALAGKLEQFQDEILRQVGSSADFNKLNVLQKEALAKATGVELNILQKLVKEQGKSAKQLQRMNVLSIDKIISSDALSNITLMTNNLKAMGTFLLSGIAYATTFGGALDGVGGMIASTIVTALLLAGGAFLFFGLKAKIAAIALKIFGTASATAGPQIGTFGASASAAIPVLLAIALVGAAVAGTIFGIGYIMKQLPPVLDSLASGFKIVGEVITNSLLQLVTPGVILGLYALTAGFVGLAASLSMLALTGLSALPALAGVAAFAATMNMLGFSAENIITLVHGRSEGTTATGGVEQSQMEKDIGTIKKSIGYLATGFGTDPSSEGYYKKLAAANTPGKVQAILTGSPTGGL